MTATVGDYQEQPHTMYLQSLFQQSSTKKHRLGTVRWTDDGRKFVYCQATAANLAAGHCVSKAVAPQDCTTATADIVFNIAGARKLTVTLSGTPTLNLYEDGWLIVKAGAGIGEMYKIRGNTVDDVPASGRCTIYLYDALRTLQVAANTTIALYANPYVAVLINPAVASETATTQEKVLAVTQRPVTASYYFWGQTKGLASIQLDIDGAAGAEANEMVVVPGSTAGRGRIVETTAYAGGVQILAMNMESADLTDAEASLVDLCIS